MRISLSPLPPEGKCRFFEEHQGIFCLEEAPSGSYCPHHNNQVEEAALEDLSLKYFYLDESNFDAITRETAESFIRGAWEALANIETIEEYRKLFGLPQEFNRQMVKNKFRKLTKGCHPDLNPQGEEEFKKINKAYRALCDFCSP